MKRAKIYEFYKLGWLQSLREVKEDGEFRIEDEVGNQTVLEPVDIEAAEMVLWANWVILGGFIANQENAALPGALQAAIELQTELAKIRRKVAQEKRLSPGTLDLVRDKLIKFEHLLEYDLQRFPAFTIEKVGIYDSDDLLASAENHLSEKAKLSISAKAKADFQAAGRCLAFGEFTACGFHAVRALESVARKYHKLVCNLATETENLPLIPLVNGLRVVLEKEEGTKASDSPLGLIIANLTRMTKIYRNPITHPHMTLDSADAAKEVFDLAAVSISLLEKNFAERREEASRMFYWA